MMPDDAKKPSARAIVRRYFVTGVLVLLPLAVTVWLLWRIISAVEGGVENVMEKLGLTYYVGYGFLVVIAVIFLAGLIAQNVIGRKLVQFMEGFVTKIPFVSKVYLTVQQIRDAFIGREHALFQSVAVIEYPRAGLYTICFVTSRAEGEVQYKTEEQVVCVFVPTTPNPTSGFLLFVPQEDLIPLSMTVEEAMKLVISGGALIPPHRVDELKRIEDAASSESDR
jgi:uncharacterized membrane protein